MTVALDAFATASANTTGTTLNLSTQTVAGSNEVLVVGISGQTQASAASTTVVWDSVGANQSMSLITSINDSGASGYVQIWGLVNPTPGNKTITASWSGSQQVGISSAAFTGADQGGGSSTFPTTATGAGASTPTLAITNVTGGMVVDTVSSSGVISAPTQTVMTPINNSPAFGIGMSRSSASGSVTFGWTSSGAWGEAAIVIAPAGASAVKVSSPPYQSPVLPFAFMRERAGVLIKPVRELWRPKRQVFA